MEQPAARAKSGAGRWARWILLTLGGMAVVGVVLTLVWFVNPATRQIDAVEPADAVVVFAGSPERLDTAVELMERGAAENLVIPNGRDLEQAESLCEQASFDVSCPDTDEITTQGEAQVIGRLAEERGWSRLITVTSVYHVRRATYLLGRCHDGELDAVTPPVELDVEDWVAKVAHEWAGLIAAVVLPPDC